MATSPSKEVKAPQHLKTRRSHHQALLLGDVVDVVDVAVELDLLLPLADLREVEVVLEAG